MSVYERNIRFIVQFLIYFSVQLYSAFLEFLCIKINVKHLPVLAFYLSVTRSLK